MSQWISRASLRWLWAGVLRTTGCLWWAKRQLRRGGAVVVVMLHRVLDDDALRRTHSLPYIVVRRGTFERFVTWLVRHNEVIDVRHGHARTPANGRLRVAVTFDDGWQDNYSTAMPILRAHGVPATLFICPGLMSAHAPFWPERVLAMLRDSRTHASGMRAEVAIEKLKRYEPQRRDAVIARLARRAGRRNAAVEPWDGDSTICWERARAMRHGGIGFGSHTWSHEILTTLTGQTARRELRVSRAAIEREMNECCDVLAYPNGDCSAESRRIVAEEGFRLAFTTSLGAWFAGTDRLAIPRVNVSEWKLTGPAGGFSPLMSDYMIFWKAWRASRSHNAGSVRRPERSSWSERSSAH